MSLNYSLSAERTMVMAVHSGNVTHNLADMARAAGLYDAMWVPASAGYTHAKDLIEPLKKGLDKLRADPAYFEQFNPQNKWGSYREFVAVVQEYHAACVANPDATIHTSR